MKRRIAIVMALVVAMSSLAACGKKETPAEAPAPAESEGGDTAAPEGEEPAAEGELEDTGELTLYYSNSTEWADPIIQEFEEQTGIKVSLVQDGTSSLFARIKAEAGNPQGDVVWGGVIDTYRANQDLLQPYTSSEAASLKPEAVYHNGKYTGFDIGPMVMVYNTDLIP